jgi:hypothetical protein
MPDDELKKLAEQQAAILEAIAAIKDQLDAGEWRRKCLWVLADINRSAENLKKRLPGKEQTFEEIVERLGCHANLVFESPQDLHTVFTCFTLIAGILEDAEKTETPSLMDLWQQIHQLIDELMTLESGDPTSLSAAQKLMRNLHPEAQDAERAAVRERFDQRSRASIDKMFARREAEAEESYG